MISLSKVERLLSGIKHSEVTGDAALAEQLRAIDLALKSLLRKNTRDCNCEECLAGDCEDCSDPDRSDPNCEGTKARRAAAEELAMIKAFATELKGIVEAVPRYGRYR